MLRVFNFYSTKIWIIRFCLFIVSDRYTSDKRVLMRKRSLFLNLSSWLGGVIKTSWSNFISHFMYEFKRPLCLVWLCITLCFAVFFPRSIQPYFSKKMIYKIWLHNELLIKGCPVISHHNKINPWHRFLASLIFAINKGYMVWKMCMQIKKKKSYVHFIHKSFCFLFKI